MVTPHIRHAARHHVHRRLPNQEAEVVNKVAAFTDDAPAALELIERNLLAGGYRVFTAPGAVEAIRLLESTPVDLVITDVNMPKKDGRQALLEIKADPDLQRIPVAIWTTSDEKEDRVHCQEAGADVYITKPPSYTELVNSVRELVTRYSSLRTMVVDLK